MFFWKYKFILSYLYLKLTEELHRHVYPHGHGGDGERPAHHALPLAAGRLELGEGLAEGGAV